MSNPPLLSSEARAQALAKAVEVRKERRAIKHQLKMGSMTLEELFGLCNENQVVAKTKVLTVIESLPGVGKVTARRIMEEIDIADNRRIQGLGVKQKAALLERFG